MRWQASEVARGQDSGVNTAKKYNNEHCPYFYLAVQITHRFIRTAWYKHFLNMEWGPNISKWGPIWEHWISPNGHQVVWQYKYHCTERVLWFWAKSATPSLQAAQWEGKSEMVNTPLYHRAQHKYPCQLWGGTNRRRRVEGGKRKGRGEQGVNVWSPVDQESLNCTTIVQIAFSKTLEAL